MARLEKDLSIKFKKIDLLPLRHHHSEAERHKERESAREYKRM